MREPAFWWRPACLTSALLSPVAAIYGAVAASRMARPGVTGGIPVLCVGNLTVGGSGKTPTALAAARILQAAGRRPFFLTRGYGGRLQGPALVDPAVHTAADVGDEALLLARSAPTVVSVDRVAGTNMARLAGADCIVMDDGLQNPSLQKNLAMLVVDGKRGIGNGAVIPAGPLRAPLDAQLDRVHAVLVVGGQADAGPVLARAATRKLPVLHGRLTPDPQVLAELKNHPVLAFAGIGDPDKFFATLREAGVDVRAAVSFPDHHRYRRAEARDLIDRAERDGLVPITTEKDWVRLAGQDDLAALAGVARALPVTLTVTEADVFRDLILKSV